ncbi:GGDEF domain-containing protein [Granulicella sibirica]|nr:GGDEF domain-containing protein [Granulicella sibirica]
MSRIHSSRDWILRRPPHYDRAPRRAAVSSRLAFAFLSLFFLSVGFQGQSFAAPTSASADTITSAGRLHELPASEAVNRKVHLIGTVSYYDPNEAVMFFQDSTGGVFVNSDHIYPVRTGDLVEVDGFANPSFRSEVASGATIRLLGHGQTFRAPESQYADLAMGRGDCRLVTVHGIVRAQDIEQHQNALSAHLDVMMSGGEIQVYLDPSFGYQFKSLLDATVEITGVAGGTFDAKNQLTGIVLYVPGPSSLRVLQKPGVNLENLPLTDIDEVFRFRSVEDRSVRVRVRGALTFYKKGDSAVLEQGGKSIYIQTRQTDDFNLGDVVDAFGFASDREYAPSLREGSLVRVGQTEEIKPRAVTYEQAASGDYSDNLISVEGTVISQLRGPFSETLVVDVDGHLVNAKVEGRDTLPGFQQQSRVRLTGICRILPLGPWRKASLFHLDLRRPSDVVLIASPPWWTVRHLLETVMALLALAVIIATWAILLRRRLVVQTSRIKRSMIVARERSRILEKISSNQPPDAVLSAICNSIKTLLPGVECSYLLDGMNVSEGDLRQTSRQSNPSRLFEIALTGDGKDTVGNITVEARPGYVPSEDRHEVYEMLSETATLAIRQSLLHQALVHHSTHDALTELPNRRLCEMRLSAAFDDVALHGSGLALIYIDVDEFKEVNDQYGHRMGDLYLKQISQRLLAAKRSSDMLARIGGDEFLVIVPLEASSEDAEGVCERLKTCFEEAFSIEGRIITGSASFGLAKYPEDGFSAEALKRSADHAMYGAKRSRSGPTLVRG